MPTARSKRTRPRMPRKARSSQPRSNSLLILECDAAKLARQSLDMAASIRDCVSLVAPATRIETIQTTTERDLLERMGCLAGSKFRTIVAIGHSNDVGMRLTGDQSLSWEAVGKWLAPLAPQQLVFVACQAGRLNAIADMFNAVPTLKSIFAPPFAVSKAQMQMVHWLVPYLLDVRQPDSDVIKIAQTANLLLTGNTPWHWRRGEIVGATRTQSVR